MSPTKRTALHSAHQRLGAKLIDFGGFEMPVSYPTGVIKEHKAVRSAAGLFDVSHMAELTIVGDGAAAAVQQVVTGDIGAMASGSALYTVMCAEDGGIVDDLIVYREAEDRFFLIVNAGNRESDLEWIRQHVGTSVDIHDISDETGLIAIQGPEAVEITDELSPEPLANLQRFHHQRCEIAGHPCLVARTGYTGEDGFEIACAAGNSEAIWDALLERGADRGLIPCGLGARDTLRLEAKLSLYGNDIDRTTTPYEAGLGWVVKLDAGDFVGRSALIEQKERGIERKLVGFKMLERGIPRAGYPIVDRSREGDPVIGRVTSGNSGITVGGGIGLGYVPAEVSSPTTKLTIDCRGRDVAAEVVKGPFYKRGQS